MPPKAKFKGAPGASCIHDDAPEAPFIRSTGTLWTAEAPLSASLPSWPAAPSAPAYIQEVLESEDEDSEKEVLQLQSAVDDMKARLAQLEMDPSSLDAN